MRETAILLLIFNRLETTKKVFSEIRKVKPKKLFIAADGPREEKREEKRKCEEVRKITENINWQCEVKRLYRNKNLGCKRAVSSAIDWFFENVDSGIILEDDCLPNASFFRFCQEMLRKYKEENKIFHIGGDNFQPLRRQHKNSYYFSKYTHIWGWATWRRAWKYYDVNMKSWPEIKRKGSLNKFWKFYWEKQYWKTIFDATYSGKIDTWDYQWLYTAWVNNALSIIPGVNLVRNIGFRSDSTHTSGKSKSFEIKTREMEFPLKHPKSLIENLKGDNYTTRKNFQAKPITVIALKTKYFLDNFYE